MATNNIILKNAALAGAMGGILSQRKTVDAVAIDYLSLTQVAGAIATAVDAAIPADGGVVTPIVTEGLAKASLLQSLVSAYFDNSAPSSTVSTFYAVPAAAIAAAYNEAKLLIE